MIHPRYDAIVVGLGAAGSATLYHLAKQGLKVMAKLDHTYLRWQKWRYFLISD